MKKHVVILTQSEDQHADDLQQELQDRGIPVLRCDQADYPERIRLSATFAHEGCASSLHQGITWWDTEGRERFLPFSSISALWRRRPTLYRVPAHLPVTCGERSFIEAEARVGIEGIFDTHLFCVSGASAIHRAESKPLQLQRAQQMGLTIPRTLLTNEPKVVRSFYQECQHQMIIKPVKTGSIKDDDENSRAIFTNLVTEEDMASDALQRVAATTHLLQEYVPKAYDVRVIVIGRHVFAAEIHTPGEAIDFRLEYDRATYRLHQLPAQIAHQALALVRSFGLQFSSMDFIVTPQHDYVWLDLNPSGQYLWVQYQLAQQGGHLPLKETMAALLIDPEEHML